MHKSTQYRVYYGKYQYVMFSFPNVISLHNPLTILLYILLSGKQWKYQLFFKRSLKFIVLTFVISTEKRKFRYFQCFSMSSTFCLVSKFRYIFVHFCTLYWCSVPHLVTHSFQFSVRRRCAAVAEISIAPTPAVSSIAKAFTATKRFEQTTTTNLRTTSAAAVVAAFNPRTMSASSAACQRAKPAALADFSAKASAAD
jgi:hypothetical protein